MAKLSLSIKDVRNIEKALTSWQGKLTWDALVDLLKEKYNITTTRQTLNTYSSIKISYTNAKSRLRGVHKSVNENPNITLNQAKLIQRIDALKLDNNDLEKQVQYLKGLIHFINTEAENNPSLKELLVTIKNNYV